MISLPSSTRLPGATALLPNGGGVSPRRPAPAAHDGQTWTRSPAAHPADAGGTLPAAVLPGAVDGKGRIPLGQQLLERNHRALERKEAGLRNHLISQFKHHSLDHLRPGMSLGSGSSKEAFALDDPGLALVVNKPGARTLTDEILTMCRLEKAGMPVAKIIEAGRFDGRDAMVMPRFEKILKPHMSASPAQDLLDTGLANRNTVDSLIQIRNTLKREGIVVLDLQYGIEKTNGRLMVTDPLSVLSIEDGLTNVGQIEMLDKAIATLQKNVPPGRG